MRPPRSTALQPDLQRRARLRRRAPARPAAARARSPTACPPRPTVRHPHPPDSLALFGTPEEPAPLPPALTPPVPPALAPALPDEPALPPLEVPPAPPCGGGHTAGSFGATLP